MPELLHLPPWRVDYKYQVRTAVHRARLPGRTAPARNSHRQIMRASVTRTLTNAQLPYFEYFVREICLDGTIKFVDTFADGQGVRSGLMRIIGGAYSVQTDGHHHTVTCEIEVFR